MAQFTNPFQSPRSKRQQTMIAAEMSDNSIVRPDSFSNHPERDLRPTLEAYGGWQIAFDYFNDALFDGMLPDVLITLTRKKGALGYFWQEKFENARKLITHEIGMNPKYLKSEGDREALSTFVHEMVHLWRHVFGPLNKRGGRGSGGYHDLVWADKMDAVGLPPKNIGCGTGTRTGYRVTHSILEGGPFDVACRALLESSYRIDWHDANSRREPLDPGEGNKPPVKKDRIKFTCGKCGLNAWAKQSARLTCTGCGLPMHSPDAVPTVPTTLKQNG